MGESFSRSIKDLRGMTLVELMVGVGLFSVLAIAMMSLAFQNSLFVVKNQNEGSLSEDLTLFTQYLENTLGNATLLASCGCNATCVYNDALDDCSVSGTCGTPILTFEYEDAVDPFQRVPDKTNCALSGADLSGLTDGLVPRGCKHVAQLVFTPPTRNQDRGAFQVPTPGRLELIEPPNGVTGQTDRRVIFALNGVSRLWCGHTDTRAREQFRIRVGMKARLNNLPITEAAPDSWHPSDVEFGRGTYREVSADITLRNLATAGVMFGKSVSVGQCIADAAASTSADQCCSGYRDGGAGVCLASTACGVLGAKAPDGAESCCSHRTNTPDGLQPGNCI